MEEQETIADIVAELREDEKTVLAEFDNEMIWNKWEVSAIYEDLADRIERAWKHEKCEIEARATTTGELMALTILRGRG